MHHKATGGVIPAATEKGKKEGYLKRDAYEGGDWENRPADTSTAGIKGARTGEVKESNAGGFKKGGKAKKAYATGGNVVDDGKAQKMPRHFKSLPVANSLQSGTFKRGGKVGRYAEGGTLRQKPDSTYSDPSDDAINDRPFQMYDGVPLGGMADMGLSPTDRGFRQIGRAHV